MPANIKPYTECFDSKGGIILPSPEQLQLMDAPMRERVQGVLDAYTALSEAEKALDDNRAKVEELTKQIAAAATTLTQLSPKVTFQNLWNDMVRSS